jgi:alcohol dehydrogenase class IV
LRIVGNEQVDGAIHVVIEQRDAERLRGGIVQARGARHVLCSELEAAERSIAAVERLRKRIGIPARIRDLGGTREQLPTFAAKAFAIKRLRDVNPRVPTEADLLAILEAAY